MTYFLGIDLGTTYTAAATARDGRVEILSLGTRAADIPSVIFVRGDESMLVGDAASRRGLTEPSGVAREFKRRFGDPTPLVLAGESVTADSLWGKLLAWVLETVSKSQGGPPEGVGITYPANWGPYKLDLLKEQLQLAGVPNPQTLTEPEAAAIAYAGANRVDSGEAVAVYDLGGGTFDAAVLRKTDSGFELIGRPEGIERLGGIDIDEAVFAHVVETLGDPFEELDLEDSAAMAAVGRLRQECVAAKEALSQDIDVTIPVMLPNLTRDVRLTRAELESMIRPTLAPTVEALTRAISSAGLEPVDLKAVLLVGGSSRIPLIGQMVGEQLGVPVVTDAHPKYSVALGAARFAEASVTTDAPAAPVTPEPPAAPVTPEAPAAPVPLPDQAEKAEPPPTAAKKKKKPAPKVVAPVPEPEVSKEEEPVAAEDEVAPVAVPAPETETAAAAVAVEPAEASVDAPPVAPPKPGFLEMVRHRIRARKMVLIPILTLIAVLAAGQVFLGSKAEGSSSEVFLAPKDVPGELAFAPPSQELPPASVIPDVLIPVASTGTDPGLYAGSRGSTSCRTEALLSFLEASENAGRRKAWASGAGIAEGDIRPYIATLTPAWTRADARVTEFGLREGKAVPQQVVLEGGSAVLLDRTGFPRVRCVSGSPLDRARKPASRPKFTGTRWKGFKETTVVVISPGAPAQVITLFDPITRQNFGRLPGSIVIIDIDAQTPGTPLTVVEPGQPSTINGALWPPGSAVVITFDNPPDTLGVATADGAGNFAQAVNIPETSRPGIHQVTMQGSGFTVTQTIYVIPRGVRVVRKDLPGRLEGTSGQGTVPLQPPDGAGAPGPVIPDTRQPQGTAARPIP